MDEFIQRVNFVEEAATSECYNMLDVIQSCLSAIDEGIEDTLLITTSASYTDGLFNEMLETAKTVLLQFAQRVLAALTNYILNNGKLVERYRDLIVARFHTIKTPVFHDTSR